MASGFLLQLHYAVGKKAKLLKVLSLQLLMGTEISITTDSNNKKKHKVRKGWSSTCSYGCTKPTAYAHTGMEMFIFYSRIFTCLRSLGVSFKYPLLWRIWQRSSQQVVQWPASDSQAWSWGGSTAALGSWKRRSQMRADGRGSAHCTSGTWAASQESPLHWEQTKGKLWASS